MPEMMSEYGLAGARWERPPLEDYSVGSALHVWRVKLASNTGPLRAASDILDDQEHIRAARFRRPGDRERYVASHNALRIILARYLNMLPEQIRYQASSQGKPGLAPGQDNDRIRFNLAHSGDVALVAVVAGREVGVDVEHYRPLVELKEISDRYFSAREREALVQLPEADWPAAFFNIWSCKEAFIKANGLGMAYPLQGFSVPLAPPPGQLPTRVETPASQNWGLRPLAVGAGYAGAVAAEGLDWEVQLWQY